MSPNSSECTHAISPFELGGRPFVLLSAHRLTHRQIDPYGVPFVFLLCIPYSRSSLTVLSVCGLSVCALCVCLVCMLSVCLACASVPLCLGCAWARVSLCLVFACKLLASVLSLSLCFVLVCAYACLNLLTASIWKILDESQSQASSQA